MIVPGTDAAAAVPAALLDRQAEALPSAGLDTLQSVGQVAGDVL